MIELTEFLQSISEPFMGSEIVTLAKCYSTQWERFSIYKNEYNALLVRFENRLLITGKVDKNEILDFASMTGIKYIEGLKNDLYDFNMGTCHSIMEYCNESEYPITISPCVPKSVFSILKACDYNFRENTDYNYWLSDVLSRQKEGLLSLFVLNDCATASVISRGLGYSQIAQVATLPQQRKKGFSSFLIKYICQHEQNLGFKPFVISKNITTNKFYDGLNFKKVSEKIIITL